MAINLECEKCHRNSKYPDVLKSKDFEYLQCPHCNFVKELDVFATVCAVRAIERGENYISPTGDWSVQDVTTPEDINESTMRFTLYYSPDFLVQQIPLNLDSVEVESADTRKDVNNDRN